MSSTYSKPEEMLAELRTLVQLSDDYMACCNRLKGFCSRSHTEGEFLTFKRRNAEELSTLERSFFAHSATVESLKLRVQPLMRELLDLVAEIPEPAKRDAHLERLHSILGDSGIDPEEVL